jgi:hypothetical protein
MHPTPCLRCLFATPTFAHNDAVEAVNGQSGWLAQQAKAQAMPDLHVFASWAYWLADAELLDRALDEGRRCPEHTTAD